MEAGSDVAVMVLHTRMRCVYCNVHLGTITSRDCKLCLSLCDDTADPGEREKFLSQLLLCIACIQARFGVDKEIIPEAGNSQCLDALVADESPSLLRIQILLNSTDPLIMDTVISMSWFC